MEKIRIFFGQEEEGKKQNNASQETKLSKISSSIKIKIEESKQSVTSSNTLSISNANDNNLEDLAKCCPTMSKKQRLWGFGICFCFGYLISFMATFAVIGGVRNASRFGFLYSFGNLLSLSGSGFLVGPCRQFQLMFKPIRRVAAIIYVGLIFVVLVVAVTLGSKKSSGPLILLLCLIQFTAAVWYSASYVPFGRKLIKKTLERVFK